MLPNPRQSWSSIYSASVQHQPQLTNPSAHYQYQVMFKNINWSQKNLGSKTDFCSYYLLGLNKLYLESLLLSFFLTYKIEMTALIDVAHLVGHCPTNWKGCQFDSGPEHIHAWVAGPVPR